MSQGYGQSSYTAWVGLCRFDHLPQDGADGGSDDMSGGLDQDQVFEAPVAVYTASAGQYDLVTGNKLRELGYRFLGSSYPKPVLVWFREKGSNKALGDLAAKVYGHAPFAMGSMKAVAYKDEVGSIIEGEKPEEDPLVITEHPIVPLPDQTPIWPPRKRDWIDEDLKALLFGQELPPEHQHILKTDQAEAEGEETPPLIRTYFIVDATLRRKFTGFFDLDMRFRKCPMGSLKVEGPNGNVGNIEYRSLFKGEAQEELKEVAPYLFDMTLPDGAYEDKGLVPDFHKDFFKSIWDPETLKRGEGKTHLDTGIFIRTTQDFDNVWRHFRKFTRIQDENGKWYYWRFWEPEFAKCSYKILFKTSFCILVYEDICQSLSQMSMNHSRVKSDLSLKSLVKELTLREAEIVKKVIQSQEIEPLDRVFIENVLKVQDVPGIKSKKELIGNLSRIINLGRDFDRNFFTNSKNYRSLLLKSKNLLD